MYVTLQVVLAALLSVCRSHEEANPLYKQLRSEGIVVEGKTLATLPAPTVPDGLDAAGQQAALKSIPMRVSPGDFTRKSVVAPYAMSIGDLAETEAGIRIRTLDVWFIVYGDLEVIRTNRRWLDELLRQAEGDVHVLSADELQKRGVSIPAELAHRASYTHAASTLLQRVRVEVTTHAVYSQSGESTLLAGTVDPRFGDDKEFPNKWRPVEISGGRKKLGPAEVYSVSAGYWKATQLHSPPGAILIEYHSVVEQPSGWFGGRDLLRSKMPLAVQSEIRTFRRKVKKAMQ